MRPAAPASARLTVLWLVLFGGIALAIRIGFYYHGVFMHDFVSFVETDAWYHMRLVDATVKHFPARIWVDPYLVYPGGEPVNAGPLFDWIVAAAALVIGFGAPSPRLVDVVGAFTPPVIGALTVVPVYVLGRELFSRRAGLWAAFIVGILPGQILMRSTLGYTDHHCLETLLTSAALMWLVLALDETREHRTRVQLSLAGGITLGCYLLTWGGGSLFVLIVVGSVAASLFVQRLRSEATVELLGILAPFFVVPAFMIAPWITTRPYFAYDFAALAAGFAGLIALRAWGGATAALRNGTLMYLSGLVACVAIALGAAWLARDGWNGLAREITRISPWRPAGYVLEATPLLRSSGRYPFPLWNEFTTGLPLALLGGVWLVWRGALTTRSLLLLIWTAVIVVATLGQVRFAYYLGVNAALLAGVACDVLLAPVDRLKGRGGLFQVGAAAVLLIAIAWPAGAAIAKHWGEETSLTDDWYDALQWLQLNSPEPFESDSAYDNPPLVQTADARPAYGVLAWWDYGYWITRIAHRIPNTNPKQTQVKEVASFLIAETPDAAAAVLAPLGTRYVIVDAKLQASIADSEAEHTAFFGSIAPWAGRAGTDYCQEYEIAGDGDAVHSKIYCFPAYYRTMAIRLYAFGGRAVVPDAVMVIRWTNHRRDNRLIKRLEEQKTFPGIAEAEQFIASRKTEHWRIASSSPLVTCTPLDALTDFRHVFGSVGRQRLPSGQAGPSVVQIYQYVGAGSRR